MDYALVVETLEDLVQEGSILAWGFPILHLHNYSF